MFIPARPMFISADWGARTIRQSGTMPKTTGSQSSRKIRTFRNGAFSLVSRFRGRVALVGICIAASALLQACSGRHEFSYATLADAIKAGEINRGWIPDYLPTSSHAIHIIYDPSSPRTWCAFEFSPADSQGLKKNLTSVNALPERLKRVDSPGVSWWPDFLRGDLDIARFHGNGFDAYVAEEPDVQSNTDLVLFAIDWAKGRGFFHRTAGQ
jgi:hypothetical protein